MEKTITLIRHGKTAGNFEKRYIGVTDEQMTLDGENEIRQRKYPKADIVFSSPLVRCRRTAEVIYPNQQPVIIEELRETDFGRFEGRNFTELANDREYMQWIESGGEDAFPGGESRAQANERIMLGFEKLLSLSEECKNISAVVHGGTIMGLLSQLFEGEYYSYHVENCEGYTFELSSNGLYHGLRPRSFLR
ncbi:MAG: histidine phosphatase family protein [Pseudobutyrivibrio sp.]|nr:histidine phosphatase family protein [Pseudobutyrivibrio sp.]